jgi:hypothetical protein
MYSHITGPNAALLVLLLVAALIVTGCGFPKCGVMLPCQ